MKVVEVKTYTFDELSEGVQQRVLDRFANQAVEYDSGYWFENMVNDAKETASFKITSLNDNPIDGAGEFISSARETAEAILENHGEVCDTFQVAKTFRIEHVKLSDCLTIEQEHLDEMNEDESVSGSDPSYIQCEWLIAEFENEIEELESEFEKDIAHEYAKLWSKELEYQTSEEAIKENIEANEHMFLENGRSPNF